ncbi:hypothetical protein GQ457_06G015410 [Hibiscus cannabinus]
MVKPTHAPMIANSQQFCAMSEPSRWVHEVSIVSLENKIDQLTNIVYYLVAGKNEPSRVCGICTMSDHLTDCCPILQNLTNETMNVVGNFPGPPQRPYNPHRNTYNPGWRDHPNLRCAQNPGPYPTYQPYQAPKPSLENLVERLAQSQEQFQNRTKSHIQELEKQISRLAQSVSRLESRGTDIEQQS